MGTEIWSSKLTEIKTNIIIYSFNKSCQTQLKQDNNNYNLENEHSYTVTIKPAVNSRPALSLVRAGRPYINQSVLLTKG